MGLIGLKGGGYPAMDSTAVSTKASHPMGTIAVDSSGGEYIYSRGCSTVPPLWSLMSIGANATVSSIGGPASLVATQTSSLIQSPLIAGVMSSAQSTSVFAWFQIYGPGTVAADATQSAGAQLFCSSVNAGQVMATTTGARIYGLNVLSSGGVSSAQSVFFAYPHTSS